MPPTPRNLNRVDYNPYIDVKCSYLKPKDLDGSFFGEKHSCFSIFHNNIRSANKNLINVEEIFRNCQFFPDIIGVTETKLNGNSSQPEIEGYKFENVDSKSSAGGVGIFVANQIDYILREDLRLNIDDCEDIWIEVSTKTSNSRNRESMVIGLIYRHPRTHYLKFSEPSKKIYRLSQRKTKKLLF